RLATVQRPVDQPLEPVRRRFDERRPLALDQAREVLLRDRLLPARLAARGEDLGDVDDGLGRLALAEEEPPRQVRAGPVAEELLRDRLRARVARLAPALHVRAQQVDERQLVALLLGVELELRRAGAPGRVVV